jgi:hypothetical protein
LLHFPLRRGHQAEPAPIEADPPIEGWTACGRGKEAIGVNGRFDLVAGAGYAKCSPITGSLVDHEIDDAARGKEGRGRV